MFSAGTKTVSIADGELGLEQERQVLAYLRSSYADRRLSEKLLPAIDVDETPSPLLPPGWEQRLDETSGRIFFVDHNT
jgi:hypothetical protein